VEDLRNFPTGLWLKYSVHVVGHHAPRKQPVAHAIEMKHGFSNYGRGFRRSQKAPAAPAIETFLQSSLNVALQWTRFLRVSARNLIRCL
jgi:hypothetical protein